jgi:hypothetical protein
MKLGAVLVTIPTPRLPFILHLLDYVMHKITLKVGHVNSNKLPLASKICLPTALQCLTLLRGKVNLPEGVSKSNPCQLKHNDIISVERITLATQARPLRMDPRVTAHQVHHIIAWDNVHKVVAYVIGLLKAEKVRLLAFALSAWGRE